MYDQSIDTVTKVHFLILWLPAASSDWLIWWNTTIHVYFSRCLLQLVLNKSNAFCLPQVRLRHKYCSRQVAAYYSSIKPVTVRSGTVLFMSMKLKNWNILHAFGGRETLMWNLWVPDHEQFFVVHVRWRTCYSWRHICFYYAVHAMYGQLL